MSLTARVSATGRVTIPAPIREKYQIKPGDPIRIVDYGGVISLIPLLANPVDEACGMLKGGESLTQALLAERVAEREREDAR